MVEDYLVVVLGSTVEPDSSTMVILSSMVVQHFVVAASDSAVA